MALSRAVIAICGIFAVMLALGIAHFNLQPGEDSHPAPDQIRYPNGVPRKFDPDGNAQLFRGNTIISRLSNSSDLSHSLAVLQGKLRASQISHLIAHLPQSSWHMTIFEGAVAIKRKPWHWPRDLSVEMTLEECTELFRTKLSSLDLQIALPLHLSVVGFATSTGVGLHFKPRQPDDAQTLHRLRDRLANLLKIRHPRHDNYEFHLSIGYLLRYLTDGQRAELDNLLVDHYRDMPKGFELGALEFCVFDNMLAYDCVLELKNQPE